MRQKPGAEKFYYGIGEVAEMLHVNASLIRYWEKEFTNLKPKKNRKGNRLFTQKDIDILKLIYHLVKEQGHTLDGAKKLLKEKESHLNSQQNVIETLKKLRAFLVEVQEDIKE